MFYVKNIVYYIILFVGQLNFRVMMGHQVVYSPVSAGSMPNLPQPLSNRSFWVPRTCMLPLTDANSLELYDESRIRKKKRNQHRPPGWAKGRLKYGELILDEAVKSVFEDPSQAYHPFASKEQCEEAMDIRARKLTKTEILSNKVYYTFETVEKQRECTNLPTLRLKSWGRCAFVAPGSNLLRHWRGEQIDYHDTVIRLGHMPLEGWSKIVGNRTDVLIGRGTIHSKHAHGYDGLKYIIGKDNSEVSKSSPSHLEIVDSLNFYPKLSIVNNVKVNLGAPQLGLPLYKVMTSPIGKKSRGPSTGFLHVLRIIFSGLCSKVNVFGMSSECGGYYHDQKTKMKLHHSCELESWSLHYLMKVHGARTNTCIWNT